MSVQDRHRKSQGNKKEGSKKGQPSSSKDSSQDVNAKQEESSSSEKENVLTRTKLDLSNHPLPPLEGLSGTLAQFSQLQKLDISNMQASEENPQGLSSLQWLGRATRKGKRKAIIESATFGDKVTWLKMSDNPSLGQKGGADAWSGIENLASLSVLNASSCELTTAPPASALLRLTSLAAIVLAHNSISSFSYMSHLPQLNTLVLSHNKITKLPKDLAANLPSLKKLSITHNLLEWTKEESPLPDFTQCSHLREVRLSGNSQLIKLPSHLRTWGRGQGRDRMGTGLETLELADCGLNDWASIGPLMYMVDLDEPPRRRRGLGNLVLKGNSVASLSGFREKILEVHQALRTLDGEKINESKKELREGDGTVTSEEAKEEKRRGNGLTNGGNIGKMTDRKEQDKKEKDEMKKSEKPRGDARFKRSEEINQTKKVKQKSGERNSKANEQETRALGRAGPPPKANTAAKKEKRSNGSAKQESKMKSQEKERKASLVNDSVDSKKERKKRKAWDEGDAKEKKQKMIPRSDSPLEKRSKEQTSVAAVIQMNKKKTQESKVIKPIWGQVGGTEASLGVGCAWD